MGIPLVTIGLQTKDRARSTLCGTIDSLLRQTFRDFELFILDNGSTDKTGEICRRYEEQDYRVVYVPHGKDIGYVANLNFATIPGTGKYFLRACDDDLYEPTFLEKCVEKLESNREAVFAGVNFVEFGESWTGCVDPDCLCIKEIVKTPPHKKEEFIADKKEIYDRLKQYILFCESEGKEMPFYCGLWKRDLVKNFEFKEYPFGFDHQDMAFVFYGLTHGVFEFTDEVLFHKRARPDSFYPPIRKNPFKRIYDSLGHRARRLIRPFFYRRIRSILATKIPAFQRIKLVFWTLFVMSRLFWQRKI